MLGLCFTDECFCLFALPVLLWPFFPVTEFKVSLSHPIPEGGFLSGAEKNILEITLVPRLSSTPTRKEAR